MCSSWAPAGPTTAREAQVLGRTGAPHGPSPDSHVAPETPGVRGTQRLRAMWFVQVEAVREENTLLRSRCEALHAKNLEMG